MTTNSASGKIHRDMTGSGARDALSGGNDSSSMSDQKYPPTKSTTSQTAEEERNIAVVKEYMRIAYSPTENKGRNSVSHLLVSESSAYFVAPSTFPSCHTPHDYADSHSIVMSSVSDLHIVSYDVLFAKNEWVLLRYTAEGAHVGRPHNGIKATGNKAQWTAAATFECEGGKVKGFIKDWDKANMWRQLGWMKGEEFV